MLSAGAGRRHTAADLKMIAPSRLAFTYESVAHDMKIPVGSRLGNNPATRVSSRKLTHYPASLSGPRGLDDQRRTLHKKSRNSVVRLHSIGTFPSTNSGSSRSRRFPDFLIAP